MDNKSKIIQAALLMVAVITISSWVVARFAGNQLVSPIDTQYQEPATPLSFSFIKKELSFLPQVTSPKVLAAASQQAPETSAKSALVMDVATGGILYEKNAHERLAAASLVKIMTAAIALEKGFLDNMIVVSQKAASQPSHLMGLSTGEQVLLKDLLYGLILVSGNDAALAIAEGLAGSQIRFVSWMNQKTDSLGLKDTKYVNPSGLDEDGQIQYTTAHDLAVVTRYALSEFQFFSELVGTREYTSAYQEGRHKAFILYNETPLLGQVEGVVGVKDGYTPEAGLCLVSLVEKNGKKILVVVLGAQTRRQDAENLIEYGFGQVN
ncbi:D-alanyl-D-alanine carboxypeptidase [Candidatus Daviesbacteria bacterium]|nr:D-alanyl-D-alanine carboxypeptidase [Candidatus Daviesbacteria bacterium]